MNKEKAKQIINKLKEAYPDATCSLNFDTPFQMLVAVVLSAQCTDDRVNKTTPEIFSKYPTVYDFNNMDLHTLEELIHPCGFYKTKAKNLKSAAKMIVEVYDGQVPDNMDDLIKIPGVGRKSANVIMLEAFHNPQGIAVDTHAKRISNKIGLSKESDPLKIEQDLLKVFDKKYYYDVNHLLVWHGRKTCTARNQKCEECFIKDLCKSNK